jgi:hypothetical protein
MFRSFHGSRSSATFLASTLLGSAAVFVLTGILGPAPAAAESKPRPQAAAKKSAPVKTASAKPAARTAKKASEAPAPAPEVEVAAADEKQMLALKAVYMGESGCEFDQKITLHPNARHPGYVDLSFKNKTYVMKPMVTATGALRLEDVQKEALMIQIANKTMVMNQKTGQRLVDACVHPQQRTVTADTGLSLLK